MSESSWSNTSLKRDSVAYVLSTLFLSHTIPQLQRVLWTQEHHFLCGMSTLIGNHIRTQEDGKRHHEAGESSVKLNLGNVSRIYRYRYRALCGQALGANFGHVPGLSTCFLRFGPASDGILTRHTSMYMIVDTYQVSHS